MKSCTNCRLWKTLKCWGYRMDGQHSKGFDWCKGHRLIAEIKTLRLIETKVREVRA